MATSDGSEDCVVQRGRSQSDPSILIDTRVVHTNNVMDQHRALHSSCLVSGVRTPPIRRNSKLASLGRIFKPWKWRKKKNEKLRQGSTGLERKVPSRQNRDDLVRKGLAEAGMESGLACGVSPDEAGAPALDESDEEEHEDEPMAPLASNTEDLGSDEDNLSTARDATEMIDTEGELEQSEDEEKSCVDALNRGASVGPPEAPECHEQKKEEAPPLREVHTPPAKLPVKLLTRLGSLDSTHSNQSRPAPATLPRNFTLPKDALRGRISTPTGSPHLGLMHPQLPPSCIIEELHRALATKHRQDSFHGKEIRSTLPRRIRKELLTVKLRNRPSKQELEDRNIFPVRSDQERQEIRQQIEMKLAKNDQTEQEERREIKQRLNRKLNQRPTVDELRDRKILIRFSDYVEVAKAQDYDRRADKPWTRLSASDKAAIRKELNEFKSSEMEVHASSKHLTRFHRP
uniref:Phosphatase and actin regulator n=1 Tax=Cyprinus carpio TaxID=7962 RepID=A0A8C2J8A6_CYPCA